MQSSQLLSIQPNTRRKRIFIHIFPYNLFADEIVILSFVNIEAITEKITERNENMIGRQNITTSNRDEKLSTEFNSVGAKALQIKTLLVKYWKRTEIYLNCRAKYADYRTRKCKALLRIFPTNDRNSAVCNTKEAVILHI